MSTLGPELISTLGFPIAACVGLYKLYREERENRREERQELRDERKKFREAIDGQAEAFRAMARRLEDQTEAPIRPDGGRDQGDGPDGGA